MALERFNIYTLKGREILERARKKTMFDDSCGELIDGISYSIDLSNDFERMLLLKREDDIDKEDTALFYQIREVLNSKSKNGWNAHLSPNCLLNKIFIVDFGNLFSKIGTLGENRYIQYRNEVNAILDKRREELEKWVGITDQGMAFSGAEPSEIEKWYPLPKTPEFGPAEMIHFMFEKGIEVIFNRNAKARKYVPFDKSQSMARNSRITFIEETLVWDVNKRLLLGSTPNEIFLSKFFSYKGLYLSSGKRILSSDILLNEETVVVLPDGPIYPGDDKSVKAVAVPNVKYITNSEQLGENGEVIIEPEKTETITINSVMDGEGIISMDYAEKINIELWGKEEKNKATSFQIRMPFIKGMVHSMDINGFLDEFCGQEVEKVIIKDCFGIERDLRKAKMIITQSMYKAYAGVEKDWFSNGDDPMKNYFVGYETYNHALYISGTNLPYKNRCLTTLNYQFLNTLQLKEEELSLLVDKHMYYVNHPVEYLKRNTFTFNLKDDENVCENETGEEEKKDIDSNIEVPDEKVENESKAEEGKLKNEVPSWIFVLLENQESLNNRYIKDKVEAMKRSLIKDIGYGRILVDGEVRYLSRDILYFLQNILKHVKEIKEENMEKLSKEIETLEDCFYMPNDKIGLKEEQYYPIFRSPHLSRNEQCVLKATKANENSIRHKYLGHLEGVVMVAYNSLVPDILGGADFDGDIVKVFAADELRNAVLRGVYEKCESGQNYQRKLPIVRITPLKSQHGRFNTGKYFRTIPGVDYVTIYHTFANKVGQISNMAIRIGKQQYWLKEKREDMKVCCEMCTILTGLEIDACKTGIHPKFNSKMKLMNINEDNYLGKFKPVLDKMHYMMWKNIKIDETQTICSYEVQKDDKFEAKRGAVYILQQLAFEFMKRAKEYSESLKDKTETEYILFGFEKTENWKKYKETNKDEIQRLKNLLKAHQYAMKLVKSYNNKFLEQKHSKWKYKILKIWIGQDKGSRENIIEYSAQYLQIIGKIKEYNKKENYDMYLEKLKNSEWPYLYHKEDKIKFLTDFFEVPEENLDKNLVEKLCDFREKGYYLLYLFLREAKDSVTFMTFEEAVAKHINKEEILFEDKSKELENKKLRKYLDEMLEKVYKDKSNEKKCLSIYLKEKLKQEKFESMYYVSKNTQILRDYFWEYYNSKEMEKQMVKRRKSNARRTS